MVAVLQGTRVSSSDAARAGVEVGLEWEGEWERDRSRNRNGNRNVNRHSQREWGQRRMEVSTEMDSVGRTCRTERQTASDGRVRQRDRQRQMDVLDRDGQHQTDVLNRETDSVRWTCRIGMDSAGRVLPRPRNRGNGGNGDEVDIPNRIQEVA